MKSNKEYRKYPNIEYALPKISDIIDLCNDCKEDLIYVQNIEEVKQRLLEMKKTINEVEELINTYKKEGDRL